MVKKPAASECFGGRSAAQQRQASRAVLTCKDRASLSRNPVWCSPEPSKDCCVCCFGDLCVLRHWHQARKLQELMSPLCPHLGTKNSHITPCKAMHHERSEHRSMHAHSTVVMAKNSKAYRPKLLSCLGCLGSTILLNDEFGYSCLCIIESFCKVALSHSLTCKQKRCN